MCPHDAVSYRVLKSAIACFTSVRDQGSGTSSTGKFFMSYGSET